MLKALSLLSWFTQWLYRLQISAFPYIGIIFILTKKIKIMKTRPFTLAVSLTLLTVLSTGLFSCKKDKANRTENFLESYLQQSGFNEATAERNANSEFGLFFTPIKTGTVKKVYVKTPAVQNNIRVTIWEVGANKILYSQVINASTANTFFSADVTGLSLTKDVEYAVTMNTTSYFERKKTNGTAATYPITVGNIKILSYKWRTGSTQVLPVNVAVNYYGGDTSFDFVAD